MRTTNFFVLAGAAVLLVGCAGPEKKLGRGLLNSTEFLRGGEMRRSIEQTALWENKDSATTTGVIRGFNRSLARTAIGVWEIATFPLPLPSYDAVLTPKGRSYPDASMRNRSYPFGGMVLSEYPTYPDNFSPSFISGSVSDTDTALGFSGGDVAPMVQGSRFRIFDN